MPRAGRDDRGWYLFPRAAARFARRRMAWRKATADVDDFDEAIAHPAWRLVMEANELLLRLGDRFRFGE